MSPREFKEKMRALKEHRKLMHEEKKKLCHEAKEALKFARGERCQMRKMERKEEGLKNHPSSSSVVPEGQRWRDLPEEERAAKRDAWRKMSEEEREAIRQARREARRGSHPRRGGRFDSDHPSTTASPSSAIVVDPTANPADVRCDERKKRWRDMSEEDRAALREERLKLRQAARKGGRCHREAGEGGAGGCRNNRVARFVKHVTVPDGTTFAPNESFVKIWRIRNEGQREWTDCKLVFVSLKNGDLMGSPAEIPVANGGPIAPGTEFDISTAMTAPKLPGRYVGFWRLSNAEGRKFGQRIWVKIDVVEGGAPAPSPSSSTASKPAGAAKPTIAESLKQLKELGFTDVAKNIELLKQHDGDVNKAIGELLLSEH